MLLLIYNFKIQQQSQGVQAFFAVNPQLQAHNKVACLKEEKYVHKASENKLTQTGKKKLHEFIIRKCHIVTSLAARIHSVRHSRHTSR